MTALITDDNTIASTLINRLTSEVGDLQIICKYCSTSEAYKHIEHNLGLSKHIDCPDLKPATAGQNFRSIDKFFIFITSGHAVSSLTNHALRPQLPISSKHYGISTKKSFPKPEEENKVTHQGSECIFVRDNSAIRRLCTSDILYLEAMGDYVKFHTDKKIFTIHCTLKSAELRLSNLSFLRVHRSYIIALNRLDSVQDGGLIIGERFIPVADNYRKILHQRMNVL